MPRCMGLTFGVGGLTPQGYAKVSSNRGVTLFVEINEMPKTYKPKTVKMPKAAAIKMPMLKSMGVMGKGKGKKKRSCDGDKD